MLSPEGPLSVFFRVMLLADKFSIPKVFENSDYYVILRPLDSNSMCSNTLTKVNL